MKIPTPKPPVRILRRAALLGWLTLHLGNASAQTNQVPNLIGATPPTFFQSIGGYLTTINTNYSFASNQLEVSIGAGQGGPILANYVSAQYDFTGASNALNRLDAAVEIRNAGIAGVIQTAEAGAGWSVIRAGDTKLQIGVLAGYDWNKSAALFEPELVVRKKATRNTFFEAGVSLPVWTTGPLNQTPAFFVGTGFTY